jgi:hypothetical protein
MAGSYVMILGMEIINTPPEHLQDCRRLQHFFESTDFNYMAPHDELKHAGTEYVLASPGFSYIAYSSENSGELGLQNLDAGNYNMRWYDCVTGQSIQQNNTGIASGRQSWKKPPEIGEEVILSITRSDGKVKPGPTQTQEQDTSSVEIKAITSTDTPNIIPVAPDQRITTKKDTPVYIQLTYDDPDGGPGPYTTSVIIQPSYGKLSGMGNDQTYTPVKGYTGGDSFTWKVNDGAEDSEISTIYISIEK